MPKILGRWTAAVFLFACMAMPALGADNAVGTVKKLEGAVYLERGGSQIAADVGSPVMVKDRVLTVQNSSVGITFRDNTTLSLGPDSEMTVDDFVFEPQNDKLGFDVNLNQGTFVFLTGQVASLRPEAMRIGTPGVNVGIRGTRFAVKVGR